MVILDLLKGKNELSNISKIADCIRNEIKEMKDQMPQPPQSRDFEPEKFEMPPKLGQFLTCRMTSQENEEQMNNRSARKRLSLAQDIVCNVTEGRVNTPKSVLLPTVVKQLTNNAEIIITLNKLGHGVSYSILSECTPKMLKSFKISNKQTSSCH